MVDVRLLMGNSERLFFDLSFNIINSKELMIDHLPEFPLSVLFVGSLERKNLLY